MTLLAGFWTATSGRTRLSGIYRVRLGKREGQKDLVGRRRSSGALCVSPAFIMGGNDQRYRFDPDDEVWIDNRIGIEEFEYTVAHELLERKMMRERRLQLRPRSPALYRAGTRDAQA